MADRLHFVMSRFPVLYKGLEGVLARCRPCPPLQPPLRLLPRPWPQLPPRPQSQLSPRPPAQTSLYDVEMGSSRDSDSDDPSPRTIRGLLSRQQARARRLAVMSDDNDDSNIPAPRLAIAPRPLAGRQSPASSGSSPVHYVCPPAPDPSGSSPTYRASRTIRPHSPPRGPSIGSHCPLLGLSPVPRRPPLLLPPDRSRTTMTRLTRLSFPHLLFRCPPTGPHVCPPPHTHPASPASFGSPSSPSIGPPSSPPAGPPPSSPGGPPGSPLEEILDCIVMALPWNSDNEIPDSDDSIEESPPRSWNDEISSSDDWMEEYSD